MIGSILSASEGHYIIVAIFEQFNISKFVLSYINCTFIPSILLFLRLITVKISYILREKKNLIISSNFITEFQFYITNYCKPTVLACEKYLQGSSETLRCDNFSSVFKYLYCIIFR